jgi:translation initiation factor IF-2
MELEAYSEGPAKGVVIESRLDKGRGPVATILVQNGVLQKGDILLAGGEYGRVRAMVGDDGNVTESAGPSMPVELLGLSGAPRAGDDVIVVNSEKKAREIALFRQGKYREVKLARQRSANLENIFERMNEGEVNTLAVVLKTDVQGSLEAISDALARLSTHEVKVNIIASGVGGITESDVNLAIASSAIIVGFNVRADQSAKRLVENEGVDLRYYSVIYDLIDEVKAALSGMLKPEYQEKIVGLAEVRDVFRSSKFGAIAGCMVIEGLIRRNLPVRVLRDNVVVYEGQLESLRRFKDDVSEVRQGMECGIGVKDYNDIKVGDQIEVFETIEISRKL